MSDIKIKKIYKSEVYEMSVGLRKLKTIIVLILSIYILCSTYNTMLNIQLQGKKISFLHSLSQESLCNASEEVLRLLRGLANDLIHIRMIADQNTAMAKQIEKYYNDLQKLLREIEFITSKPKHRKHQKLVEEDKIQTFSTDVCPEVFKGTTYGYPFYKKGFETINCRQHVQISKLVTFVMDGISPNRIQETNSKDSLTLVSSNLLYLVESVRRNYSNSTIHIVLETGQSLTRGAELVISKMRRVSVYPSHTKQRKTEILQDILNHIKTKYVLIGQRLTRFSDNINLNRLIRVLSSHNGAHFAGGSIKNLAGHWLNGCHQSQLKNYTLSYRAGYFKSFHECLVCDHLAGPFLAKTESLQELGGFTSEKNLNMGQGLYRDLFLRAKWYFSHQHANHVISCPDVMFNVHPNEVKDGELVDFAKKHQIRKILEADGRVRWFGCRRGLSYRSDRRCNIQSGYAVPPCCLENLADAVKFVMARCEEHGILCELQEGTLLGAVKLNKVLPWERDADIAFLSSDFNKLRSIKNKFEQQGYVFRESGKS